MERVNTMCEYIEYWMGETKFTVGVWVLFGILTLIAMFLSGGYTSIASTVITVLGYVAVSFLVAKIVPLFTLGFLRFFVWKPLYKSVIREGNRD